MAIPLERDDAAAFGDNIGGVVLLLPFFIFALVYYFQKKRTIHRLESDDLTN
jgi:hypothetical protein